MCVQITTTVTITELELELDILNNSFPWLTAELRGYTYYWQHISGLAVSPVVSTYSVVTENEIHRLSNRIKYATLKSM